MRPTPFFPLYFHQACAFVSPTYDKNGPSLRFLHSSGTARAGMRGWSTVPLLLAVAFLTNSKLAAQALPAPIIQYGNGDPALQELPSGFGGNRASEYPQEEGALPILPDFESGLPESPLSQIAQIIPFLNSSVLERPLLDQPDASDIVDFVAKSVATAPEIADVQVSQEGLTPLLGASEASDDVASIVTISITIVPAEQKQSQSKLVSSIQNQQPHNTNTNQYSTPPSSPASSCSQTITSIIPASSTTSASSNSNVSPTEAQAKGASVSSALSSVDTTSFAQSMLASHNKWRAQYGAAALSWDSSLAQKAGAWADTCQWFHEWV